MLLSIAAYLTASIGLQAQNNTNDSIRVHVIKDENGTILEIDTIVPASQQANLFQWMSAQGIEIAEVPPVGEVPQLMEIEMEEIIPDSGAANGKMMRIPIPPSPPSPPSPPDAPGMKMVMIRREGPPVPGEQIQVIVTGDTVRKIVRRNEVIITDDSKGARIPSPPSPPLKQGEEQMTVYPNPSNGNVTIEFNIPGIAKTSISVTDMNGKEVYSENLGEAFAGPYKKEISLGTAQGTYTVTVKKADRVLVKKVLVR